uniref:Centrosomal protein kizuna n=1 Tax=Pelusios castaneus TaxID=367368 RepID=A0A8C8RTL8_9SAUR
PVGSAWGGQSQLAHGKAAASGFILHHKTYFLSHRVKINFIKLKKYLKEICERQKNAVLRNQQFLKEFDRIEAHIRTFSSSEALQQLKVILAGINTRTAMSRGLYHPATIFMGRQMSAISKVSVLSVALATEQFCICFMPSSLTVEESGGLLCCALSLNPNIKAWTLY